MGPPDLDIVQLGRWQDLPYAGAGGFPGRPRRQVSLGNAGAQAGVAARPGADGPVCPGLRPNTVGETRPGPDHRPPHDPPGAPGPLAGRLRRQGQPDDPQPGERLDPGGAARQAERRALHPVGAGHQVHHPPGPGPAVNNHGRLEHRTRHRQSRTAPALGHRIHTWERQTSHAYGITWFLSELAAEARADGTSELQWSIPTARSDRAFNRGGEAISPDAVGHLLTGGLHVPFYFEHELRARHPRGVAARLRPYLRYYRSDAPREDQPPFPTTLFMVDTEEVAETYAGTASRMTAMALSIMVSSREALSCKGVLGKSWRPLWDAGSPPVALSALADYGWDGLRRRMHLLETR